MAVLFRGEIWVDYRFAYLQPDDDDPPTTSVSTDNLSLIHI